MDMSLSITKAMIFAAGLGTRLKPFTDNYPKALFKVNGKTLLDRNVEYLKKFGITDIIINLHHFGEQIIAHAERNNNWGINIAFSDESAELLDTGGGLLKATDYFEDTENFILYNADILTNLHLDKMMEFHLIRSPMATLSVSDRISSRYFLFNQDYQLCGWENISTGEKKISRVGENYHQRAFSGIHIVNRTMLTTRKAVTKFSITDWYLDLCSKKTILGYEESGAEFVDVGKMESLSKAERLFN